ncbi:MAG: hypothetical protein EP330_27600 [Deltaproteobacteria bacterium]|nr:MAG: hypothetical protein EP330_27600 [Deltaproteobacteria bacterium]
MPSFVPHPRPQPEKRNLQKVPFVELFDGRLQGVVSSGSSADRVYVSLIEAGTGNFYCSTNNNRPCGGLGGGGGCKHIGEMVNNAIAQYGAERVARYLGVPEPQTSAYGLIGSLGGAKTKVEAGEVFARFLDYLRYVELPASTEPRPEMAWFVTG